jgi:hypothetical protein
MAMGGTKMEQEALRYSKSQKDGHTDRRDGNRLTSTLYCAHEHESKWLLVLYFVISVAPAADKLTDRFLHFTAS